MSKNRTFIIRKEKIDLCDICHTYKARYFGLTKLGMFAEMCISCMETKGNKSHIELIPDEEE